MSESEEIEEIRQREGVSLLDARSIWSSRIKAVKDRDLREAIALLISEALRPKHDWLDPLTEDQENKLWKVLEDLSGE